MSGVKGEITEIFSSIQGEGIFLGARQIFVRFAICNLDCLYCDEKKDLRAREYTTLDLMSEVKFLELSKGPHHSVSFTGGEPLLYADFLKAFLPGLKKKRFTSYLETNGTLPGELEKIIADVDIIAMDFKLPSSTGERPFWKEHGDFLKIASAKKVFVKAVVTERTSGADIERAVRLVRNLKENVPLILQPATPVRQADKEVDKKTLLKFLEIGSKNRLENIRVIPQVHKILNIK